jgi:AcrR family transcriptional regulator
MVKFKADMETKEKIYSAAKVLFLEKGYKKTTYKHIAEMVSANSGLITYYYGSKSRLGVMVYNEYMTQVKEIVRQQFSRLNLDYDLLLATATEIRLHGRLLLLNRNLSTFYADLLSENVLYKEYAVAVDYFRELIENYGQPMPEYKIRFLAYGNFGFQHGVGLAYEIGEVDCSNKEYTEANIEAMFLLLGLGNQRLEEILKVSAEIESSIPEVILKKGFEISVSPRN